MKRIRVTLLFRNLYYALAYDIKRNLIDEKIENLKKELVDTQQQLQIQMMMSFFEQNKDIKAKFLDEISYIKEHGLTPFPYKQLMKLGDIESGVEYNMSYIIHSNKKLFFPPLFSLESVDALYRCYIEKENILGGGYTIKTPHSYQTKDFKVENGDVVIDLGCAEALFALDVVERASKVYLIESNELWMPALRATFAPYRDKSVLINKKVTAVDTEETISLKTIFQKEAGKRIFVKMDIEGYEYETLLGCREYLKDSNIRWACCTYHRPNDADIISELFRSAGRCCHFSDGYMLFNYDVKNFIPPYFRKGVLMVE